jgi:ribonuclease P protein component
MTSPSRFDKGPPLQSSDTGDVSLKQSLSKSRIQSLTGVRLRKHADYQRAYQGSRKRQSASMSWFLARQSAPYTGAPLPEGPRVGLTAGKVLGKAHERNRIKRRMRDVLRRHVETLPEGFDLILHPRRTVLTLEFAKLEVEIVRILHQARIEAARMLQNATGPVARGTV